MERNKTYESDSIRKKRLDLKLAFMIATDLEPFSIVSRIGFSEFVHELDPKYNIPSSTYLKDTLIPTLFGNFETKLRFILRQVEYLAVTTDAWSLNMEAYISCTCHFIFKTKLYAACLETRQIQGSHTADHLAEVLEEVFAKWEIQHKVVCIVTDNGANIVAAISKLRKRHMSCVAHTLNLVASDCLKVKGISEIINKCKSLVTYFKSSTLASDKLSVVQSNANLKTPLKLIQSVPTRWNSVYFMIKRIMDLKNHLAVSLACLPKAPPLPTAEEFQIMDEFVVCFACIQDATQELSGELFVTESLIIPIIRGINIKLNSIETANLIESDTGKNVFATLEKSISERLHPYETRTSSMLATLLDPRIKKNGFRIVDNALNAHTVLENELATINTTSITSDNSIQGTEIGNETEASTSTDNTLLGFLNESFRAVRQLQTPRSNAIIELRQYMEAPVISLQKDPIQYWEENKRQFPALYSLSLKYMPVPATSVPTERIFSSAGLIVTEQRNRLKAKYLSKLLFIRQNKFLNEIDV